MSRHDEVEGKQLQLALRTIGPELKLMVEEALGRSVEFVLIAMQPADKDVAIGYLVNTRTDMNDVLVKAQACLNVILTHQSNPNHPLNLH